MKNSHLLSRSKQQTSQKILMFRSKAPVENPKCKQRQTSASMLTLVKMSSSQPQSLLKRAQKIPKHLPYLKLGLTRYKNVVLSNVFDFIFFSVKQNLMVTLATKCKCPCEDPGLSAGFELNSTQCSNHGSNACGICHCHPGYSGKQCECDSNAVPDASKPK